MEVQGTWSLVRRKEIELMGLKDLNLIDPPFFQLRHVLENPSAPVERAP